jgi:hypothetical protein
MKCFVSKEMKYGFALGASVLVIAAFIHASLGVIYLLMVAGMVIIGVLDSRPRWIERLKPKRRLRR